MTPDERAMTITMEGVLSTRVMNRGTVEGVLSTRVMGRGVGARPVSTLRMGER